MRVVNRKTFLMLPEGTIFASGTPWAFGNLQIKGESLSNDWYECDPSWVDANDSGEAIDRLDEMLQTGKSYPCETAYGRDGRFDDRDVFLVYEKPDLEFLRDKISEALALPEEITAVANAEPTGLIGTENTGKN